MSIDIERLKALALSATRGTWVYDISNEAVEYERGVICDIMENPDSDGLYIAAANPAVMLELLEIVKQRDELYKIVKKYSRHVNGCPHFLGHCDCGFDAAMAKAGAL